MRQLWGQGGKLINFNRLERASGSRPCKFYVEWKLLEYLLSLQRILHPRRSGVHQPPQLRLELLHFLLHPPRYLAVAEVALDARAQTADVLRFGEIHLEEKPRACRKGQHIFQARRR